MSIVKIAVSVYIDEDPIWHLPLETNPKAATRLDMEAYTKVVKAAEAELKTQVMKKERADKKEELKQQHGAVE